jgi:hypothetical protein
VAGGPRATPGPGTRVCSGPGRGAVPGTGGLGIRPPGGLRGRSLIVFGFLACMFRFSYRPGPRGPGRYIRRTWSTSDHGHPTRVLRRYRSTCR